MVKVLFTGIISAAQGNHRTLCAAPSPVLSLHCVFVLTADRGRAGAEGAETAEDRFSLREHFRSDGQNPCDGGEWQAGHAAVRQEGKKGTARSACQPVQNETVSGQR